MKMYKVTTDQTNIYKITGRKIYDLNISDVVTFFCNSKEVFADIECTYENVYTKKALYILKNYWITFISCIIFIIMIIFLNKAIISIEFENDDNYNEEVYTFVQSKLKYYGKYAFLDEDITNINKEIRSKFYFYQWVSVEKKGTSLVINISKADSNEINSSETKDKNTPGSLYSKYDAFVRGYYVKKGQILVKNNISVSKGDELISGNVYLYGDKYESVHADGYVIGEVIEIEKVKVLKENIFIERTGRLYSQNIYVLFGKVLTKENKVFTDYDVEYETIFSLGKMFEIRKAYYYEIGETLIKYDEKSAESYAKSMITSEFIKEKSYDFEKIISIILTDIKTDDEYYYLSFVVKSIKDIVYFKKY